MPERPPRTSRACEACPSNPRRVPRDPGARGSPALPPCTEACPLSCQVVSTGGGGHVQLLTRAVAQLTYRSLCPPDDLADRGLLRIPGALYARDALQLWEVTAR